MAAQKAVTLANQHCLANNAKKKITWRKLTETWSIIDTGPNPRGNFEFIKIIVYSILTPGHCGYLSSVAAISIRYYIWDLTLEQRAQTLTN